MAITLGDYGERAGERGLEPSMVEVVSLSLARPRGLFGGIDSQNGDQISMVGY